MNQTQLPNSKKARVLSVDALRGFDMIWILGAEKLFLGFYLLTGWQWFKLLDEQMQHSAWHGLTAYDLIFPLFIFLSGVSLGLAAKPMALLPQAQRLSLHKKAIKRLALLLVLGVVYNHGWGTGIPADVSQIRYASVLGKIAIAWYFTALIAWYCSNKWQYASCAILLVSYSILLQFVSIGHYGGGQYGMETALNAWFDQHWLPGIHYRNLTIDPEGLLSNIASINNALIGLLVGKLLKKHQVNAQSLLINLIAYGVVLLILGGLFSVFEPINKSLWTSAFTLLSCGICCLLLALFYLMFDIWHWQKIAKFFAVIGVNSILIYLSTSLFDWQYLVNSLFGGVISALPQNSQLLISTLVLVSLQWLFLYWLDKRKIYFKV